MVEYGWVGHGDHILVLFLHSQLCQISLPLKVGMISTTLQETSKYTTISFSKFKDIHSLSLEISFVVFIYIWWTHAGLYFMESTIALGQGLMWIWGSLMYRDWMIHKLFHSSTQVLLMVINGWKLRNKLLS